MSANTPSPPLLDVRDLAVHFPVTKGFIVERRVGTVKAVDGVSFSIPRGTTRASYSAGRGSGDSGSPTGGAGTRRR